MRQQQSNETPQNKVQRSASEFDLEAPALWSRTLVWLMFGTGFIALIFGFTVKIDEVVSVQGDLEPVDSVQPLDIPEGGVVKSIHINEGDRVKKGDLLISLEPAVEDGQVSTLTEMIQIEKNRFEQQSLAFKARIQSLSSTIDTNNLLVNSFSKLRSSGAIAETQYLQQLEQLQKAQAEQQQAMAELKGLKEENRSKLVEMNQQLTQAQRKRKFLDLRAPSDGYIFDIKATGPGYYVRPNQPQPILKLIPSSRLEAKVFIKSTDIGFVAIGNSSDVRVDAYPFSEFGSLPGVLTRIGNDSLPSTQETPYIRFPAVISLRKQILERNGKSYALRSGQTITANIIAREKPVIALLTDAISRAIDSLKSIRSSTK